MSYDALRRGRYSLHHQVYCITTVTRDRHPLFTDITAARLRVCKLRGLHEHRWSNEFDPTDLIGNHRWSNEFDPTGLI